MKNHDNKYLNQYNINYLCGIDEAGRGPLAGPVVAAAVILPNDLDLNEINDSKKLSKHKREKLYKLIYQKAISIGVGIIDNKIIDDINILEATKLAMQTALDNLKIKPELVLTDYVKINTDIPQINIVKGDQKSQAIAAASIISKVTRDQIMLEYSKKYPNYGFEAHQGYPTKLHLENIKKYGITEIHRKSFRPIKEIKELL